jgi:hypothetical protein
MNMRGLTLLVMVVMLVACDTPGPNLPPLSSGPASNILYTPAWSDSEAPDVGAYCDRIATCLKLSETDLAKCKDPSALSKVTALLPDPAAFLDCFGKLTCDKIENMGTGLLGCMDLDEQSAQCSAGKFHYCNKSGKCVDISCTDYCVATNSGTTGKCAVLGPYCTCSKATPLPTN